MKISIKKIFIIIIKCILAFAIFIGPIFWTKSLIHPLQNCFPVENLKSSDKIFVYSKFEEALKRAANNLVRASGRLKDVVHVDLYVTNKVSMVYRELMVSREGASEEVTKKEIDEFYNKEPLYESTAYLECPHKNFYYGEKSLVKEDLPIDGVTDTVKEEYNECENFKYVDKKEILHEQRISFFSGLEGEICLEARPTKISYVYGYAIFFAITVGIFVTLREAFKIIRRGHKYFSNFGKGDDKPVS